MSRSRAGTPATARHRDPVLTCWPAAAVAVVLLTCGGPASNAAAEAGGLDWRYVAESPEGSLFQAPLRAVRLNRSKPEDVKETAEYRGRERRYAQIRYGTPNSTRVVVAVDKFDKGGFDLYADLDRDRIIQPDERIPGKGRTRKTLLDAVILHKNVPEYRERTVIFRLSRTGGTLAFGTAGYAEGTAELTGETVALRRVDGDGNGFFSDRRDRVWIDRNGDGAWDAFTEQFPYMPVLRLDGKRYALRSQAHELPLSLRAITGTGTLRLRLKTLPAGSEVVAVDAMLIGEDGSAVAIRGVNEAVTVPVGRYAFGTVTLSLKSPQPGTTWNFVFSRTGAPEDGRWYRVQKGREATADPLGKLRFVLKTESDGKAAAGESLTVNPRLYTEDGLLINSCGTGEKELSSYENGAQATVKLCRPDKTVLSSAQSGFA